MLSSMAQYLPKRLPLSKYLYIRYPVSRQNSAVGRQGLEHSPLLIGARVTQRKGSSQVAEGYLEQQRYEIFIRNINKQKHSNYQFGAD